MRHDSPETPVFWRRKSRQNSNWFTRTEAPDAGGVYSMHLR